MLERASLTSASGPAPRREALVVLVAGSVEDRVRILTQLGDASPLLVVSTAQEAAALLSAADETDHTLDPAQDHESGGSVPDAHPTGARPAAAPRSPELALRLLADRRAVSVGSAEISLTPLEYGVLASLLTARGKVRSFADLSHEVWGTTHVGDGAQVHAVIKRLRRKLADVQAPLCIEVVRGVGFRAVPARRLEAVSTAISS